MKNQKKLALKLTKLRIASLNNPNIIFGGGSEDCTNNTGTNTGTNKTSKNILGCLDTKKDCPKDDSIVDD